MAFDPRNPTGGPSIHKRRSDASILDLRNPTGGPSIHTEEQEDTAYPVLFRGVQLSDHRSRFLRNYVSSSQDLDLAVYLNEGNLVQALMDAKGLSPAEATKVAEIARVQGIPEDAVWENKEQHLAWKDAFDTARKLLSVDPETKRPRYPYTVLLSAKSRSLAASVLDDSEVLTGIEEEITRLGKDQEGRVTGLITRFASSKGELAGAKVVETLQGMAKGTLLGLEIIRALQVTQLRDIVLQEGLDDITDALRAARESEFLASPNLPRTTFLEEYPTDVIGAAPQLALGFLGAIPASILMAAYIAGSTEEELEQLGIEDEQRRRLAGLLNAALQLIPNYLVFNKFSKISKGGVKSASDEFLKFIGLGVRSFNVFPSLTKRVSL